ncbi:MAG: hypothetical protein UU73_C0007G0009 [Candidatus Daviesbacteria bacterium GW2011_GWA1_41_61]|uniref:SprT-like domain-containing protein n=1 Tax=Candidatus Daviesbacteria bacterium GW2011_GWA2_40_9 TaxID=1618424 RepID=A0A0G0X7K9_9BACT|nr:MAG: hypothetical protein UU26_C0021G0003 [Candidatus Daviesbacteria bacterium GW2011_GWC1_40_9]KKR83602.1 MAG: hypothetical protein UU29_C0003G0004 [Candidatus Daviesbacteria bacterium GW2011_GWA2_40_9]KKR92742.1 MAG: hypothetical protein UU44_C0005G0072 [Candidatus Daviesbacteria bacterium GW2011_GWB1_41_15]KKS14502.1 MAG: hypothetical protein UU73_C0007G0009 [Candidatus Daviesbacteria bacterium GW2011_GWA1_41_61]
MRDNTWLLSRLDYLWSKHFADINQPNRVFIRFGRFARLRFGSIMLDRKSDSTYITITGMFQDVKIPLEVVDHTIAHELCHYTHGFSSPHVRLHKYPHEGGVIKKEMERRGMTYLYKTYRLWIRGYRKELKTYYRRRRI